MFCFSIVKGRVIRCSVSVTCSAQSWHQVFAVTPPAPSLATGKNYVFLPCSKIRHWVQKSANESLQTDASFCSLKRYCTINLSSDLFTNINLLVILAVLSCCLLVVSIVVVWNFMFDSYFCFFPFWHHGLLELFYTVCTCMSLYTSVTK
jgi:hypothetical protein